MKYTVKRIRTEIFEVNAESPEKAKEYIKRYGKYMDDQSGKITRSFYPEPDFSDTVVITRLESEDILKHDFTEEFHNKYGEE